MYRIIVCRRSPMQGEKLECIKCGKEIEAGTEFYGDSGMEGAPFHSPLCKECYKQKGGF